MTSTRSVIRHRRRMPVYMDAHTRSGLVQARFDYRLENHGGYPLSWRLEGWRPGRRSGSQVQGATWKYSCRWPRTTASVRRSGSGSGTFAYCNDAASGCRTRRWSGCAGLDTLVVDALRYTVHPSHANVEQALAWIARLKPRRAIPTNLHVDLDYAKLRAELPAGVEPAFDGLGAGIRSIA